jgi:hypothetical protein
MSHQEKIERINAELNTTAAWQQRWQIEREHNERLSLEGEKIRTAVQGFKTRAVERYALNRKYAEAARESGDSRRYDGYEIMCSVHSGMVRALDDVLQVMDMVSREER